MSGTSDSLNHETVKGVGVCLGAAPQIDPNDFVGRMSEIDKMSQILQPGKRLTEQRRLVLGGMGGIGKTQLAITYARDYQTSYTSVFWLNATSEATLKASYQSVTQLVLSAEELGSLNEQQALVRAHQWLSDTRNTRWLLIFDNYDTPDEFSLRSYYPYAGHGSIIITTRLPELVNGRQVRLQPFKNIDESLNVLQKRSQRENIKSGKCGRSYPRTYLTCRHG